MSHFFVYVLNFPPSAAVFSILQTFINIQLIKLVSIHTAVTLTSFLSGQSSASLLSPIFNQCPWTVLFS